MSPAVASLLRRLVSLVAGASAATQTNAALNESSASDTQDREQLGAIRTEQQRTSKLVFGKARHGAHFLASHRSHSSHRSHASHSSHYSGTSGGYRPAPSAPPAAPPPPPRTSPPPLERKRDQPKPAPAPTVIDTTLAEVLKKLPKLRSRWPSQALLTKTAQFNLYEGDKIIGVVTLNPGTKIKILAIKPEHAIVRFGGHESPLPVPNTDIIDRMGGSEAILACPDDASPGAEKPAPKPDPKK